MFAGTDQETTRARNSTKQPAAHGLLLARSAFVRRGGWEREVVAWPRCFPTKQPEALPVFAEGKMG